MKISAAVIGIVLLILIAGYYTNNFELSEAPASKPGLSSSDGTPDQDQGLASSAKLTGTAPLPEQEVLIPAGKRITAEDFTLSDLNGNEVSLKDLQGKFVYLNFWATWCKWCKKEMPALDRIAGAYTAENFVVLAIDTGEDRDTVNKYVKDNGYRFRIGLDPDKKLKQAYQVMGIPESILIDQDGKIAYRRVGAMQEAEMKLVVEALLH